MNNTKKLSLLSVVAIAAFMVAAATVVPGHDAMAYKGSKYSDRNSFYKHKNYLTRHHSQKHSKSRRGNNNNNGNNNNSNNNGGVRAGNTRTTAIQSANNSQHAAFGAGSSQNTATNSPTNVQSQSVNSGSTGAG